MKRALAKALRWVERTCRRLRARLEPSRRTDPRSDDIVGDVPANVVHLPRSRRGIGP